LREPARLRRGRDPGQCRRQSEPHDHRARRARDDVRPERVAWEGVSAAPAEVQLPQTDDEVDPLRPWIVIVWNDPINLMSYVVLVFQKLFGYNREKATELMLDVHQKGRAVVSSGTR